MNRSIHTILIAASLLAPAALSSVALAQTQDAANGQKVDVVTVDKPWARATPGQAANGAAYLTLTGGARDDALISVSTPAAATAEVHQSSSEGGVMRMRPVKALPVKAGQTVKLAPGGYHVMLMGLKQPLAAGQSFPLTLTFEHAPPATVQVEVRGIGTQVAPQTQGHMH